MNNWIEKKKRLSNHDKREYLYRAVVGQNRERKSQILGVFDCFFF